jgi:hypothetical protein
MPSHRGNDHVCLSDAARSIPPLDGEGVARLRATGGVRDTPTPARQEARRTSPQGGGSKERRP